MTPHNKMVVCWTFFMDLIKGNWTSYMPAQIKSVMGSSAANFSVFASPKTWVRLPLCREDWGTQRSISSSELFINVLLALCVLWLITPGDWMVVYDCLVFHRLCSGEEKMSLLCSKCAIDQNLLHPFWILLCANILTKCCHMSSTVRRNYSTTS